MRMDSMGLVDPFINRFLRPRTIRRIDDGRRVTDEAQLNGLKDLPENTLRDLGFTATPS